MLWRWLPWKWIVRHLARRHGLIDPMSVLSRLSRLAQPSEVAAPMELLRAGVVFHARGALNAKVIQQNLDWTWPWWVQRQFDPSDPAFLPRGFAISHVNLTHRNWTAVGLPGCNAMPIVDPRGLVTPWFDGWSLDAWVVPDDGRPLRPAEVDRCQQTLDMPANGLAIRTECADRISRLAGQAEVHVRDGRASLDVRWQGRCDRPGWLVVSLRPFNPEGVSLVERISLDSASNAWTVDRAPAVRFDRPVDRHCVSTYQHGDVAGILLHCRARNAAHCTVGLATAAAMFRLDETGRASVTATTDLHQDQESRPVLPRGAVRGWSHALDGTCRLRVPDAQMTELWDAAVRTLALLCPIDPVPGPYTYKRFWFRDAVMLLHGMLAVGLDAQVWPAVERFFSRQSLRGFFQSQQGEWDSNGQVLWLLDELVRWTGRPAPRSWAKPVDKAVRWIDRKRTDEGLDALHAGLLPAGFSAEHLGNNDYYYWDDFWSVAGLRAAGRLGEGWGDADLARDCRARAESLQGSIERSLAASRHIRGIDAIPASPYRRMDAGAVGSLAAGYPLRLRPPDDPAILATADYLHAHCLHEGAFFQQMIHSGCNAYLTLHLAQVLLRAGDRRYWPLVRRVAELASPTGQWPEAVHPRTGGGCMGDGQHGWAAAEWLLMLRAMFVRREEDSLVLAGGIPGEWLDAGETMSLGPTPTQWGPITVTVRPSGREVEVTWKARWSRGDPDAVEVRLPGASPERETQPAETGTCRVPRPAGREEPQ